MPYKDLQKRKEYNKNYSKGWEKRNRKKRNAYNRAWRKNQAELFREFKKQFRCEKCGEDHPACLEFHHNDPTQKEYDIGNRARTSGKKKLLEEISKCRVLCANCHRKLHQPP